MWGCGRVRTRLPGLARGRTVPLPSLLPHWLTVHHRRDSGLLQSKRARASLNRACGLCQAAHSEVLAAWLPPRTPRKSWKVFLKRSGRRRTRQRMHSRCVHCSHRTSCRQGHAAAVCLFAVANLPLLQLSALWLRFCEDARDFEVSFPSIPFINNSVTALCRAATRKLRSLRLHRTCGRLTHALHPLSCVTDSQSEGQEA